MELAFKQRMVGAIFILSLGVILIPVLFETPHVETKSSAQKPSTPDMPDVASVNEISYVFADLESNFAKAHETLAQADAEPLVTPPTAEINDDESSSHEEAKPTTAQPVKAPVVVTEAQPVKVPVVVADNIQNTPVMGDWTIQLGAFSSRQNAGDLLKKLAQLGFESYLKDDKQRKIVRVFVAPGVNHENAQLLLSKLDKQLGIKGMIVRFNDE